MPLVRPSRTDRRLPIARRTLLKTAAFAGLGAAALPFGQRRARAAGTITVLNWQGYGTDEEFAIEAFQEATGTEVVHDYFNSEQEMLTKLRTNPGTYDVVLINGAFTEQAAEEQLIQPIDPAAISHFDDLIPNLRDASQLNPGGEVMGIAWVWGMTAVAYNTEKLSPAPTSIEVLWDPAHASKVSIRDDAVEAVSIAALATGQDMNRPQDLEAVKQKLLGLKGQIATFWSSEDEWNKLFEAGTFDVSVYWSGSAARSRTNYGLPVGYMVPEEGAIGWFDGLSLAADAPNPEAALAFIDYMVDPAFYETWATSVGAPASANARANDMLPAEDFGRQIHADQAAIDRLQFMAPLTDAERQSYSDLWASVKTELAR